MTSIIEDLWNGNITSAENCGVGDPEIEKINILIERHKEILSNDLAPSQMQVFEKYVDCTEKYVYLISKCAFHDGFSLASRLTAEALSNDP